MVCNSYTVALQLYTFCAQMYTFCKVKAYLLDRKRYTVILSKYFS